MQLQPSKTYLGSPTLKALPLPLALGEGIFDIRKGSVLGLERHPCIDEIFGVVNAAG